MTASPLRSAPERDGELEIRIEAARVRFGQTAKQEDWERLKALVGQRSPEQVRKMERAMGIK